MTTKERLHELVDELSEQEAADTLQYVVSRRVNGNADEWGDLDAQTDRAVTRVMHDLAEEERTELGGTIAEAWGYERRT